MLTKMINEKELKEYLKMLLGIIEVNSHECCMNEHREHLLGELGIIKDMCLHYGFEEVLKDVLTLRASLLSMRF